MTITKINRYTIKNILLDYDKSQTPEQKKAIANKINMHFKNKYPNLRSFSSQLSLVKKMVMNITKDPELYLKITVGREIYNKVSNMNKKELEKERVFKEIPKKYVEDVINEFRNSYDLYEIIFYLLLATGRRLSEVIENYNKFRKNDEDEYTIFFSGFLKKKEDIGEKQIIILDKQEHILNALQRYKIISTSKNKKNIARSFQNNIKKLAPDYKFKSHELRSIYANYLFTYNNDERQIYNAFIRKVLHHKFLVTSVAYSDIKIID